MELSNGDSISANLPGDQLFHNASGIVTGPLQYLYTAVTTGTSIPVSVTEVQNALDQVNQQRVFYENPGKQPCGGAGLATVASNFAQAPMANQAALNAAARVLGLRRCWTF